MVLSTNIFFVTRNVVIEENVCPFVEKKTLDTPIYFFKQYEGTNDHADTDSLIHIFEASNPHDQVLESSGKDMLYYKA